MGFRELNIPLSVSTTSSNPIRVFFNPVLAKAVMYDVAVGYFSSKWIRDAAEGIAQFACNGGRARWVLSPELSEEDYKAIRCDKADFDPSQVDRLILRSFEKLYEELNSNTRKILSWLIADKIMEFRIGIPINELSGIMHAKMGILRDANGEEIGFSGSYNLTGAASINWEKIDIFCCWKSAESSHRTEEIKAEFETMWQGNDPNLAIYRPSEIALERFFNEANRSQRPYTIKEEAVPTISIPSHFLKNGKLRQYQQKAVDAWFKNNGKGIFNMATGSGKTVTALSAATKLCNYAAEKKTKLTFVIVVPFKHLADQWEDEAKAFGFETVKCYDLMKKWRPKARKMLLRLSAGEHGYAFFVTVNKTFSGTPFQRLMESLPGTLCLIADEMHNLGANTMLEALPEKATFRLGLSATPDRYGDEQGTKALARFFGPQLIEFGLKEAIERRFLCQYYYYPVPVPLTEEEMEEYKQLSIQIARAYGRGEADDDGPSDRLKGLLIKRARLVGMAANKLSHLASLLLAKRDSSYNIVYCGDASDGDERHVEKVLRLIGGKVGMRANKFTSEESAPTRQQLLSLFGQGEIQTLVAIRCLDEGVDIPRAETAFILASSTNRRQFIQRRGRVLRRAPGKETATIYDFIAIPNIDQLRSVGGAALNVERKLVERELGRVNEFAELALNRGDALRELRDIKKRLHLMDM